MRAGASHPGYTLIEAMVVAAVVALLAAIVLPLVREHIGSAQVARVLHHHDAAVRVSKQTLTANRLRITLGQSSGLPRDSHAWIALLSGEKMTSAPGGGAPFIAGESGNDVTGAVGIHYDTGSERVAIARPAFRGLAPMIALVDADSVSWLPP